MVAGILQEPLLWVQVCNLPPCLLHIFNKGSIYKIEPAKVRCFKLV